MKRASLILWLSCVLVASAVAAEPLKLKLWPDGPPTAMVAKSEATAKFIQAYGGSGPDRVTDISDPTITIFRPEKPNGTSVIVAPGGGFVWLSSIHEGTQVCEWLNSLGVTAVLLEYRSPTRDAKQMHELPVQDAQRALGLVRHHAAEWNLDPKRVGMMGFSAGANISGHAAWDRGARTYPQDPKLDDPRGPDFLVFVYGGGFLDKGDPSKWRPGFSIPADSPPAFFLIADDDDQFDASETAKLYIEYKKRDLSAELHIYPEGGHGFGMRQDGKPINDWPRRCAEWMKSLGYLGE